MPLKRKLLSFPRQLHVTLFSHILETALSLVWLELEVVTLLLQSWLLQTLRVPLHYSHTFGMIPFINEWFLNYLNLKYLLLTEALIDPQTVMTYYSVQCLWNNAYRQRFSEDAYKPGDLVIQKWWTIWQHVEGWEKVVMIILITRKKKAQDKFKFRWNLPLAVTLGQFLWKDKKEGQKFI